jgi:hypothetical protein
MSDLCRDVFKLLETDYAPRFGECVNKLRLLLDFLAISYKLSFVFVSDGSLQDRLRTSVIAQQGQRMTKKVCAENGIEEGQVFSLNAKDQNNVLALINLFTLKLTTEEAQFRKIWD